MKLELHPDAVVDFNEEADKLLLELKPISQELSPTHKNSFHPDTFVSAHITDKDIIGEIRTGRVNQTGSEVAKYFGYNDITIGLEGESYKKLESVSQKMQRRKELYKKVSVTLLTNLIFDWLTDKYKNATNLSMIEYVLSECEGLIQESEIWIPVAMLYIQSEIKIGQITLKTITKEIFEHWRAEAKKKNLAEIDKLQEWFNSEQKGLQGLAASTIKLCAEPERAFEIALEETEKSLSLLRFFSPSNLHPEIPSYCTVLGKENVDIVKHLIIRDNKLIWISSSVVDKALQDWVIDDQLLSIMRSPGLDILSNVLVKDCKTGFQDIVLDSLMLYSRSSLAKNLADKLVYILVALESILLKNENEPIQHNIGERMAFFIGADLSERKSIIKNVKKAYTLRSSFIHHGRTVEDIKTLTAFMRNAWMFFSQVILNVNHFITKEQFIDAIENRKLR